MKYLFTSLIFIVFAQFGFAQNIFTDELDGTVMTYKYSGNNAYNVKLVDGNLSYRFLSGSKPEAWWGPFPYEAVKTENGEYMLAWYEESYGDYVTLLINIEGKYLYGSAIIVGKNGTKTHFQKAQISKINR